jgi:hypothetical protein
MFLFRSIPDHVKRNYYLQDNVYVDNKSISLHSYHGHITRSNIIDTKHTYCIDDVVTVETVNPQLVEEKKQLLSNEITKLGITSVISIGITIVSGIALYYTLYTIPSCIAFIASNVTTIISSLRINQYNNEYNKWIPIDHCVIRRNIPKTRSLGIYNNNYIHKYVSYQEANVIWKDDLKSHNNKISLANTMDEKYNSLVEASIYNPLMPTQYHYFGIHDDALKQPMIDCNNVINAVHRLICEHDHSEQLLQKLEHHHKQNMNYKYEVIQSSISGARNTNNVVSNNPVHQLVTGVICDTSSNIARHIQMDENNELTKIYAKEVLEQRYKHRDSLVSNYFDNLKDFYADVVSKI